MESSEFSSVEFWRAYKILLHALQGLVVNNNSNSCNKDIVVGHSVTELET